MDTVMLQAHRGVSTEYPENTAAAVLGAACQGYQIVELDPAVTKDGRVVLLHDKTINRTARHADGTPLQQETLLADMTYDRLLQLDFGRWFDRRFAGERIPLLADILALAKQHGLHIKLDNKFQRLPPQAIAELFALVSASGADVGFTVNDLQHARLVLQSIPHARLHYDGIVNERVLRQLAALVPAARLTVWLPYPTRYNTWVTVPTADETLCALVKKYARLGLWILSEPAEYRDAVARFAPHIIETTGKLKPRLRSGVVADMHTHSIHSHDSSCPVADMAAAQQAKGVAMFVVTDHCNAQRFTAAQMGALVQAGHGDARAVTRQTGMPILHGMEIGDAIRSPAVSLALIEQNPCDVVIGSVHAVNFPGWESSYSGIDFGAMGKATAEKFMDQYFDDLLQMLQQTQLDILAHLTCPLRYINGKYGLGVSCRQYSDKIDAILQHIISHGIALELNTSCLGSAYDEFMPEEWILQRYAVLGGYLVTLGSDAHTAARAAHGFGAALQVLRKYGFENIYYYKDRIACQCAIIQEENT